ncbi:probable myosin-binding protein 5 [Aristolochia californica]|uniref:probable myosin-binding protein 5 n=1 Tax=Aristolochia californica TaxID=171875 RepID=UPI0035DF77E8
MTPKGAIRNQKGCGTVASALASAAFEWFLMFLLFLDGMFSYLVTKFASCCQLQTPCLLCSRLDHIFGGKKPGFYYDLICEAHKSEISSLVYCRIHEKHAEAHGTCEPCFLSSVRENKQNPKVCPSFCGTVVQDLEFLVEDGYLVADHLVDSSSPRRLSGCSSPFSGKTFVHKSVQTELVIKEATLQEKHTPDIEKEHSWTRQDTSNKRTGKLLDSSLRSSGFDQLSHIGYTELKISSDTESEYPISDDEDRTLIHEVDYLKEDVLAQNEHLDSGPSDLNILPEVPSIDLAPGKLIHQTPNPEPSDLVSDEQLNVSAPVSSSTLTSNLAVGHGLEELNWDQVKGRCASSGNILQSSEQVSEEKLNTTEIGEDTSLPVKESIEFLKPGNGPTSNSSALPLNHNLNSSILLGATSLDINEAYKLAIGYQANHHPLPELITSKDAARIQEELKMLLSQISASRGFELAWNDMSPRVQASVDDVKTSEASGTAAPSALYKRLSIERNESGFESLDGSIVSDIEGESAVDRLKRQIELDRKSMAVLYKELEEERSASAIAANQAMAMINRLQEEKAAMQMEALQYQRMMDEQAEYDQEDLQKANECLAQKDKELQDLEAELECYRRRFEEDSAEEKILEPMTSCHETICPSNSTLIENTAKENGDSDGNKISQTSLLDFQDEKLYILKCLKRLEKKLHLFSNHGIHSGVSDFDKGFCDIKDENAKLQGFKGEQIETEDVVGENGGSCNKEALAVNGENLLVANDGKLSPDACSEPDFSSVEKEISRLNERLLTLEADREFLEHTINSLRNGNEGVQFIQEIATHLQELRRIEIRSKETAVP